MINNQYEIKYIIIQVLLTFLIALIPIYFYLDASFENQSIKDKMDLFSNDEIKLTHTLNKNKLDKDDKYKEVEQLKKDISEKTEEISKLKVSSEYRAKVSEGYQLELDLAKEVTRYNRGLSDLEQLTKEDEQTKKSLDEINEKLKKNYIVCIDSDGCAMDTMNVKHLNFFGPYIVEYFGIKDKDNFLKEWNRLNLFSLSRGINRFAGLSQSLVYAKAQGEEIGDISKLQEWVQNTPSLSNQSLEEEINKKRFE